MTITRRQFLKLIAASVAVAVLPVPPPAPRARISMRFVQHYTFQSHAPVKIDVIYGYALMRPDLAVRLSDG